MRHPISHAYFLDVDLSLIAVSLGLNCQFLESRISRFNLGVTFPNEVIDGIVRAYLGIITDPREYLVIDVALSIVAQSVAAKVVYLAFRIVFLYLNFHLYQIP
jgi:hypothetical protein